MEHEVDQNVLTRPKKKRCTKRTDVQKEFGDSKLRTKTICLHLGKTLKKCEPDEIKRIRLVFNKISRHCGSYRRLTGLLANYVYIRKIEQGLGLPKLDKKFFDQCWAALDFFKGGVSRRNSLEDLCTEFIEQSGFDVGTFPPSVDIRIRESITKEMETVAKNYIQLNMENKIKGYIKTRLSVHESFREITRSQQRRTTDNIYKACVSVQDPVNTQEEYGEYSCIVTDIRGYISGIWTGNEDKNLKYIMKAKPESFLRVLKFISDSTTDITKKSTLVPMWKMSSAIVYYSSSVLKTAFKDSSMTVQKFCRDNFDLKRASSKGYVVNGFRTDGYQVQISYVAPTSMKPPPKNTENLVKAGYQIPLKPFGLSTETSGLFRLHQERNDAKRLNPSDIPFMRITSVDPGCSEVISVRTCPLDKCDNPSDIIEKSTVWSVSGEEYSLKSGRTMLEEREELRRRNAKYRNALEQFNNVPKKTCLRGTFLNYCSVVARTLKVLYAESTKSARKRSRLQSSRMVQSTIDSMAHRISTSGSSTDQMSKNIVLFGDGTFQAKRGHASAPRKSILRALSSRCIVGIMDEHWTSQKCPGGCHHDMIDVQDEYRVRQCAIESSGGDLVRCSLSRGSKSFRCDRDESATINFCRIGYSALINRSWPEHLHRVF